MLQMCSAIVAATAIISSRYWFGAFWVELDSNGLNGHGNDRDRHKAKFESYVWGVVPAPAQAGLEC